MLVRSDAHCFQLQIPNPYTARRGTVDQISSTDKGESNEEEKECSSSQTPKIIHRKTLSLPDNNC
jgi:hypothetical protein